MRLTAVLVLVCLVIGGAFAMLMPAPAVRQQATAGAGAAMTAPRPDRRQLQQELLRAANRLENSPCDKYLREPLRAAILALVADAAETRPPLDQEASKIIRGAAIAGVIRPQEIGLSSTGQTVVVDRDGGGRLTIVFRSPYNCEN